MSNLNKLPAKLPISLFGNEIAYNFLARNSNVSIPVILYDIDNNVIPLNPIAKSNNFFFRSYLVYSVEIIEDIPSNNYIYSVNKKQIIENENDLFDIQKAKLFELNNFAYTLYLEKDCKLLIRWFDGTERIYFITLKIDNVLNEEQEHYADLLINHKLPTFEELEPAIISQNKADIIKRLLLDYKYLLKHKGTKTGIEKFLNLIGFEPENIKVLEEYETPLNKLTLTPNKETDWKTGNYHLLYDNWNDEGYTNKNMPKRLIQNADLVEFFEKLFHALVIANVYFTLPEQDITFFGMNYSANSEQFLSVAGNANIIYFNDVHYFQKDVRIDIYNQHNVSGTLKYEIVVNNLQEKINIPKTSFRIYHIGSLPIQNNLFLAEREIFDGEIIDEEDISKVYTIFGNLMHIDIKAPLGYYYEINIKSVNNPFVYIKIDKKEIMLDGGGPEDKYNIVTKISDKYLIEINVYDKWNNREKYNYEYNLTNIDSRIKIISNNSTKIYDEEINNISLGISSPSETNIINSGNNQNYILPQNSVPSDLKDYFNIDIENLTVKYLTKNRKLSLLTLNKNFILNDITETIPLKFIDNYLHIIVFPFIFEKRLCIRFKDEFGHTRIISYERLDHYSKNPQIPDYLFITLMNIFNTESNQLETYNFITTRQTGIDINKNLWDFVLVPSDEDKFSEQKWGYSYDDINDDEIISLWDLPSTERIENKIDVNYDFDLFYRNPGNIQAGYITDYPLIIDSEDNTKYLNFKIKSIYPRLVNINDAIDFYNVMLGDILTCRIDEDYISGCQNIKWQIHNSFNNKLLYETNDYMLKYRINEKTVYNITLTFEIDGLLYTIVKKSLVTSFRI